MNQMVETGSLCIRFSISKMKVTKTLTLTRPSPYHTNHSFTDHGDIQSMNMNHQEEASKKVNSQHDSFNMDARLLLELSAKQQNYRNELLSGQTQQVQAVGTSRNSIFQSINTLAPPVVGKVRVPCCARGMPSDHNIQVSY